jgi:transglutaminase-like putative cysteine protease
MVLLCAHSPIAYADAPPHIRFSARVALEGRHPEVLDRAEYRKWLAFNPVEGWRETPCVDERQQIVVTGRDEDHVLMIEIVDCQRAMRGTVRWIVPTIVTGQDTKAVALQAFREQHVPFAGSAELYAQPDVTFDAAGIPTLHWQVIADDGSQRIRVDFQRGVPISTRTFDLPKQFRPPLARTERVAPLDAEDLAENGLHHPGAFLIEARQVDDPKKSILERARLINDLVRSKYQYNSSVPHVRDFILSDLITRDKNAREGVCGEFAVVEVSYLRALGIAAHLVFLSWQEHGLVSHAAVEFQDEHGIWHAMDALSAFDEPWAYARRYGVGDVLATLPSHPDDSRSSTSVNTTPDVLDDGMFNYNVGGDFLLEPGLEGGTRPVYSKDK